MQAIRNMFKPREAEQPAPDTSDLTARLENLDAEHTEMQAERNALFVRFAAAGDNDDLDEVEAETAALDARMAENLAQQERVRAELAAVTRRSAEEVADGEIGRLNREIAGVEKHRTRILEVLKRDDVMADDAAAAHIADSLAKVDKKKQDLEVERGRHVQVLNEKRIEELEQAARAAAARVETAWQAWADIAQQAAAVHNVYVEAHMAARSVVDSWRKAIPMGAPCNWTESGRLGWRMLPPGAEMERTLKVLRGEMQ